MKIEREKVEALLFSGTGAPRFTQDTPILPDVWIRYAEEPDRRHALILTPFQDPEGRSSVSAGLLAGTLDRLLSVDRLLRQEAAGRTTARSTRDAPKIAYNQTDVYAELTFEELVRVALPLSSWWKHRRIQAQLAQFYTQAEARSILTETLRENARARAEGRSAEQVSLSRELLWMAGIIGTLAAARHREGDDRWPPVDLPARRGRRAEPVPNEPEKQDYYREVAKALVDLFMPLPITPETLTDQIDLLAGEASPTPQQKRRLDQMQAARKLLLDATDEVRDVLLYSTSLCRPAGLSISRSRAAIKADAAKLLFEVSCKELVWAVVDSGIDACHPAFRLRDPKNPSAVRSVRIPVDKLKKESRVVATYDFSVFRDLMSSRLKASSKYERMPWLQKRLEGESLAEVVQDLRRALSNGRELDWESIGRVLQVPHNEQYQPPAVEHGTHVAGILGADWPGLDAAGGAQPVDSVAQAAAGIALPREICCGMCPDIRLYDLRILDEKGQGDEFNVMAALQFVRYLNAHKDIPVINGVNLSLSLPHDVANFACGRTPICEECERLVGAGIVVVTAAGNEGYLQFLTGKNIPHDIYQSISITDPGNAEGVITVGSTHRYEPHTYGVSYFSSRGPTGDGRAKPDLVAPGEKITAPALDNSYKELDGTSMAAPHVSGAAALLMARHRELVGQPARIKRILCETATDLGRERYFQGYGMVDVLRAIQSV